MIDFDALVLNRCQNIFALAVKITLTASAPELPPMLGRGVYSSSPQDVIMQDETIFSDQQTSLGIRLADYEIPPGPGDLVEIIQPNHPAFGSKYWIGDSDNDGQGGAMLLLRTQAPPP